MFKNGGWCIKRKSRIDKTVENLLKNGVINWTTGKHQRAQLSNKKTPWPAIVVLIAWFLSLICIAGGSFFVFALGINFGNEKTYQWVTAMVSSVFASLLITQPFLVIN